MVARSVGGLLSSGSDVSGRLSAVCPCLFEPSRVQTRVILGDLIRGIIMGFTGPPDLLAMPRTLVYGRVSPAVRLESQPVWAVCAALPCVRH